MNVVTRAPKAPDLANGWTKPKTGRSWHFLVPPDLRLYNRTDFHLLFGYRGSAWIVKWLRYEV